MLLLIHSVGLELALAVAALLSNAVASKPHSYFVSANRTDTPELVRMQGRREDVVLS